MRGCLPPRSIRRWCFCDVVTPETPFLQRPAAVPGVPDRDDLDYSLVYVDPFSIPCRQKLRFMGFRSRQLDSFLYTVGIVIVNVHVFVNLRLQAEVRWLQRSCPLFWDAGLQAASDVEAGVGGEGRRTREK